MKKIEKIEIGLDKIENVYHFADIHIRNIKRHDEYREVFEKFYSILRNENSPNSISVLAGDLVHSKTEMSPELIKEASDFLISIADIHPLILIAGNHDCNLNNNDRLDALSPIIKNIKHKNIHYLKDSGVYKAADCVFTVMSVFEEPKNYIKASQLQTDKTKIALFHGPVNAAKTDVGYVVCNKNVPVDLFGGYDIVMLGDIHKHQVLKDSNPVIVYPGSFLQQNFGESPTHHGYCKWNIPQKTFTYHNIPNDYGFFTVEVKDGKLETPLTDMPKKARLRVKCFETVPTEVKKIVSKIRKTHDITELTFVNASYFSDKNKVNTVGEKVSLDDITSIDFQNNLIRDYLNKNFVIEANVLDEVIKINQEISAAISKEDLAKNTHWKPKRMEWSNLFSYGEGNVIDFTKTKDIIGLFGKNTSGKTSAIEVLTFCLFDKCSRTFKASNIMNTSKMSLHCKFVFESNGDNYYIERVGKKNKKGDVKVDVDFYKFKDNDETKEKISLNDEARRSTNNVIKDYIGSFEDFVLTRLSQQNNNSNFIEKGQTERKDLLAQFMGINIFDKLYNQAAENNKEVSVLMKKINKAEFTRLLVDIENSGRECSAELQLFKTKQEIAEEIKDNLNNILLLETQKIKTLDSNIPTDIPSEEKKILKWKDLLHSELKVILEKKEAVENAKKEYDSVETQLKNYDISTIDTNLSIYTESIASQKKVASKIEVLKRDINSKLEKLKHLEEHKYDPNCKFCMDNVFVKDAIATKETLNQDKEDFENLKSKLEELTDLSNGYYQYQTDFNIFTTLTRQLEKAETVFLKAQNDLKDSESKRLTLESKITDLELNIKRAKDFIETIENNKVVNEEIKAVREKIGQNNKELKSINDKIIELSSKSISLTNKISDINNGIKEATELEDKYNAYNFYLEAVKRDGIPYQLISKAIPTIENEVNNILSQIVEFGVILTMDGKNINASIVYEDKVWPLEMASGAEKFISSIALRVALTNISNLPKTNFLIVDEGMGVLDSDNLPSMYNLFTYLKTHFDFIIVISHLDSIKDMVDNIMDIKKENGFSSIQYV